MMNLLRTLLPLLIALSLSGCVSFPQTPEEFRTTGAGRIEFTVDHSLQGAYALVASNTIRCHEGNESQMSMVGSSFVAFPTGQTRVEGVLDAEHSHATITVRYFNPTASGLLQVIDFEGAQHSGTLITVHRLNDTTKWQTATQAVKNWFSGSAECYEMWQ
jgi:hypothetical protein